MCGTAVLGLFAEEMFGVKGECAGCWFEDEAGGAVDIGCSAWCNILWSCDTSNSMDSNLL